MFEELEDAGIDTSGFGHFGSAPGLGIGPSKFDYGRAAPILLRWLPQIEDPRKRESIIRSVTGEAEARANGGAQAMIDEFRRSADDRNLAWAAGNALSTLAGPSDADAIIGLLCDRRFGTGREMLCDALKRTKNPRAPQVLVELLDDDDINGHAISALRAMRNPGRTRSATASATNARSYRGAKRRHSVCPQAGPSSPRQARRRLVVGPKQVGSADRGLVAEG